MINAPADALASTRIAPREKKSVVHAHLASAKMPLMPRHTHTPWRDGCIIWCVCALLAHPCVDRRRCAAGRAQFTFYALHCTPARARQGVQGGNEKRLALGDASAMMPHAMVRGFSPWAPMQRASQVYSCQRLHIHTCVCVCAWVSGKLAGRAPSHSHRNCTRGAM
jgi:hypothetical protein